VTLLELGRIMKLLTLIYAESASAGNVVGGELETPKELQFLTI